MFKYFITIFFSLSLLAVSGCGQPVVKFGGTVKFSDGSPVTSGTVNFDSGTYTFLGHIDSQGNYAPGIEQQGGGIPEGTYKVWLTGTDSGGTITQPDGTVTQGELKPTVDAKFCRKETSGLTFEAKPGGAKTFDVVVEKPGK